MVTLIPKPSRLRELGGTFNCDRQVNAAFAPELESLLPFYRQYIGGQVAADDKAAIRFLLDDTFGEEAYALDVSADGVRIRASGHKGGFYALQTLRQLGRFDLKAEKFVIPCVSIEDAPRFRWRGLALDDARNFFGVAETKRMLDHMAMYKLNVMHWHLTDDVGWRIEIKKYPRLTEIGSKRRDTQNKGWKSPALEGKPHSGYYTQEEIRDVVAYAAERGIMVVPEIDMPAHFAAAIAAYPWLACREKESEVHWFVGPTIPKSMGWSDWNRPACAGQERTYEFTFDVLDEVMALFPAPYLHIGGDEAPKDEWKQCPHCQKLIQEHALQDEEGLQGHFNNRIRDYVAKRGRRLIGWNEILKASNLDKTIIGQYWTIERDRNVERYVDNGGEIIMSKHQSFYFDMTYAQRTLKATYTFEPEQQGVKPGSMCRVLGVEGELWSEFIYDREKRDVFSHPRMEALAEVGWSPREARDWKDFRRRMDCRMEVLDALDIEYAHDKIANPPFWMKGKRMRLFYNGNPYYEVELNRAYKKKAK